MAMILDDEQKLGLLLAAIKIRKLISEFELNQEYLFLESLSRPEFRPRCADAQNLEMVDLILRPVEFGIVRCQSPCDCPQPDTSLNETICNLNKLVNQIKNASPLH